MSRRLEFEGYLDRITLTEDGSAVLHLGVKLTPTGARLAAERLAQKAEEAELNVAGQDGISR